jgi:hypothetical protein
MPSSLGKAPRFIDDEFDGLMCAFVATTRFTFEQKSDEVLPPP